LHWKLAMSNTPKAIINFEVPKDLAVRIDECAARELLSRTAWVRRAVAQAAGGPAPVRRGDGLVG
jgi:hypothetical protein